MLDSMWTAGVLWSIGSDHEAMHWLQHDSYEVGHNPRTTVSQGDGVWVCEGVHWFGEGHVCCLQGMLLKCVVLCCMLHVKIIFF
jgi:hypothetical protein